MRIELTFSELELAMDDVLTVEQSRLFTGNLEGQLQSFGMPLSIDKKLLFWQNHFTPNNRGWATYANGQTKGGTLRYKSGVIRVPASPHLLVYETEEEKQGFLPRGLVTIPRLVVCHARDLTLEELAADDFANHEEMLVGMRPYYPDIQIDSVVSFYWFGKTSWAKP